MKSSITAWIRSADHPGTRRRASITSVIVGFVLIAVNHGARHHLRSITRERIIQMCLPVIVPYSYRQYLVSRQEMNAVAFIPNSTQGASDSRSASDECANIHSSVVERAELGSHMAARSG